MSQATLPVICFGSSLTASANQPENHKWATRLAFLLENAYPGRYDVYNRGIGGNTSAMALDRMDADVMPLLPGWVIIGFGGNDSNIRSHRRTPRLGLEEYASNFREMHRLITENGGWPIFLNYHLPIEGNGAYTQGNGKSHAQNLRPYQDRVREIASETGTPLIDIPRLMEAAGVKSEEIVIADGIHLNPRGNHFYAEQVGAFLLNLFAKQPPTA